MKLWTRFVFSLLFAHYTLQPQYQIFDLEKGGLVYASAFFTKIMFSEFWNFEMEKNDFTLPEYL